MADKQLRKTSSLVFKPNIDIAESWRVRERGGGGEGREGGERGERGGREGGERGEREGREGGERGEREGRICVYVSVCKLFYLLTF